MSEEKTPVEVYQLRVWIREISPAIWRRVLVRSDSTIQDLHYTLQLVLGWSDFHLHRFVIHGKEFGVSRSYVPGFPDRADQVQLADFNFRLRERFLYEYDFGDLWQHEIRLEQKLPLEKGKSYPFCIGGNWKAPPEDCGGPWAYMALRQHFSVWTIADQLAEIIEQNLIEDYREDIHEFMYWLSAPKFNRKEANRRLKLYADGSDQWRWVIGEPL